MITKSEALQSLRFGAEWILDGEVLTWLDTEQTQPTDAEIEAEVARLQAEYDAQQYARDRATEYPSIGDQLDYIYHNGIDAWKTDMIDPVKAQYPKPTQEAS